MTGIYIGICCIGALIPVIIIPGVPILGFPIPGTPILPISVPIGQPGAVSVLLLSTMLTEGADCVFAPLSRFEGLRALMIPGMSIYSVEVSAYARVSAAVSALG